MVNAGPVIKVNANQRYATGLDSAARMNTPGTTQGNWRWRLAAGQLTAPVAARLGALAQLYGRS
jgi:4-alpha-glucanotransferase